MRRRIVAGNWKLHGDHAFAHALMDAIAAVPSPAGVERVVLPPLPYLADLAEHYGDRGIALGSQDVSVNEKGAYTGEVSATMARKSPATREAPPISPPSTSGCENSSAALSALQLPP